VHLEVQYSAIDAVMYADNPCGLGWRSFMGAPHWGLQMANYGVASSGLAWQRYALSTVPSLVAWASLCMPVSAAYITQITAFNALLAADVHAYSRRLVPMWYPGYVRLKAGAGRGRQVKCNSIMGLQAARVPHGDRHGLPRRLVCVRRLARFPRRGRGGRESKAKHWRVATALAHVAAIWQLDE
jgi:hypothetical protein